MLEELRFYFQINILLKKKGFEVKIICFLYKVIDRVEFDSKDIIKLEGESWLFKMIDFVKKIYIYNPIYIYCHSGYIENFIASLLLKKNIQFSTILLQCLLMN